MAATDIVDEVAGSGDIVDEVAASPAPKSAFQQFVELGAAATVPRPQFMRRGELAPFTPEQRAVESPPPIRARDVAAGALNVISGPSPTPGAPEIGTQAVQGAEHLATPGQRWRGATELVSAGGEALSPLMGVAGIANPVGAAKALATGYATSKAAKYGVKIAGGGEQAQDFAETAGFWLPTGVGILHPRFGVGITPEEVVLRGGVAPPGVGPRTAEVRIPRGPQPQAGGPTGLEPPTIEGNAQPSPPPTPASPTMVSDSTSALAQADRVDAGLPATPPPPPAPAAPPPVTITPEMVNDMSGRIARIQDPAAREQAMQQVHGWLAANYLRAGTFTDPHTGKLVQVADQKQAEKAALDVVNTGVENFDKAQEAAKKVASSESRAVKPAPAARRDVVDEVAATPAPKVESTGAAPRTGQPGVLPAGQRKGVVETAPAAEPSAPVSGRVEAAAPGPAAASEGAAPTESEPTHEVIREEPAPLSKDDLSNGDHVILSDGRPAEVDYVHPNMNIVRLHPTNGDKEKIQVTGAREIEKLKRAEPEVSHARATATSGTETRAAGAAQPEAARVPAAPDESANRPGQVADSPVPQPAAGEGAGKQPWQMRAEEAKADIRRTHTAQLQNHEPLSWHGISAEQAGGYLSEPWVVSVRRAIAQGKPVTNEVLQDYEKVTGMKPPATSAIPPKAPTKAELAQATPAAPQPAAGEEAGKSAASTATQSVKSNAPVAESGLNRGLTDLGKLGDIAQSRTFSEHGLGGFDVPTQRKVMSSVLAALHQPEIRDAVIKTVPINVVDELISLNPSVNVGLHDSSVRRDLLSGNFRRSVSLRGDVADALVSAVARLTAKEPFASTSAVGGALDEAAAVRTLGSQTGANENTPTGIGAKKLPGTILPNESGLSENASSADLTRNVRGGVNVGHGGRLAQNSPEVLKDYPDLQAKPAPPAVPQPPAASLAKLKPAGVIPPKAETGAKPETKPAPGRVGDMKVSDLTVAPQKFQYKLSTDAAGTSTLLKDTRVYNPDLAGVLSVWTDSTDGKTYIVNGHHRYELAVRTGQKTVVVRHIIAKDATEARAIGALQNIAEGRGTAIDAAKFFRDTGLTPEDLKAKGISMGEATANDGLAISRLSPEIFGRAVAGTIGQGRAKVIGEATSDHAEQKAILSLVEKREARGTTVTNSTLAELIRLVKGAEKAEESTADLFGTQQITKSLALEKAEISAHIKQQLAKDKKLFGFVAKEGRAEELARAGNKIEVEKSKEISIGAAQSEEVYNKLSERGGPISTILDEAARRLAKGDNAATVKTDAYQQVRAEVSKTLGGGEGSGAGRSQATPRTEFPQKQVPVENLSVGDTFVDEQGEPRRIVAIEGNKIKTADGTLRTYTGSVTLVGDLNSSRALLAQGGKAHPPKRRNEEEPTLPGMKQVPAERAEAVAEHQGKELTAKLVEPPKSIEAKAGEIEQKSPLFRDTAANPQKGLFADESGTFEPGKLAEAVTAEFNKEIKPTLQKAGVTFKQALDELTHLIAPRAGVPTATLDSMMRLAGQREKHRWYLDQVLEHSTVLMDKLPQEQQIAFVDRYKLGEAQPTPQLNALAEFMRKTDERTYRTVVETQVANLSKPARRLWEKMPEEDKTAFLHRIAEFKGDETLEKGPLKELADALLTYKDDHFRVIWKVVPGTEAKPGARGVRGRRPLEGSKGFLRHSTLDTMSEGVENGGEPLDWNPVRMFQVAQADAWRYITAQRMWKDALDMGERVFVKKGAQVPEGFRVVEDKIGNVRFPAASGEGMIEAGHWAMAEPRYRLLENMLSRDWFRDHALPNLLMSAKNHLTAWRLSLSPFHAFTTSVSAGAGQAGRGLEDIGGGILGLSPARIAKGAIELATFPVAPVRDYMLGTKIIRYATNPEEFLSSHAGQDFIKQYPEAPQLIEDLFPAGAKLGLHEDERLHALAGFRRAIADERWIAAGFNAPFALNQQIMRPLFGYYIPRLKLASWLREYSEQLVRHAAELDAGTMTRGELARKTWDATDNIFGQMNWDARWWDRTFKASIQFAFRAFTWFAGNGRLVKDAGTGQAQEILQSLQYMHSRFNGDEPPPGSGAVPRLDPNLRRIMGLFAVVAATNAALQYAMTRETPKDYKDLLAARIGGTDEHGNPRRVLTPAIVVKDAISLYSQGAVRYLGAKVSDLLSGLYDVFSNQDFRSAMIHNPQDSWWTQRFDDLRHVIGSPIGVSNYRREREQGASRGRAIVGELGFSPAPKIIDYTPTPAERMAHDILKASAPRYTPEETAKWREKRKDLEEGTASHQDTKRYLKEQRLTWLERDFKKLQYPDALKVYDAGNEDEKDALNHLLRQKRRNFRAAGHRQEADEAEAAEAVAQ